MNNAQPLAQLEGTIVLAGAGKMGGAMLSGWLAQGLDASRVAVIEPHPSDEIKALAAQVRLNPTLKDAGAVTALVIALKPQMFREAGPALKLSPHARPGQERLHSFRPNMESSIPVP